NIMPEIDPEAKDAFVDDYLLYLMAQASAAVSAEFHARLAKQGVSVATWRILASLYPNKTLNVGELARSCLAKQPTLTRQLDKLCAEGLTERQNEDRDRRGVLVRLTAEGQTAARRHVEAAKRHEAEVFSQLSPTSVAQLKSTLTELIQRTTSKT
ncbi:MAG: MarR family transcriptional regulator, partial [Pseudomonadota bacterium]